MYSRARILLATVAMSACMATLYGCDRDAHLGAASKQETLKFSTEYQSVFMANGQILFGKLEGAGTDWPVLRDVYSVQNQMNPDTKQVASTLVKRSSELHGPDYMIINARQIAFIEPVSAASRVAQVIKQAQSQPPALPK